MTPSTHVHEHIRSPANLCTHDAHTHRRTHIPVHTCTRNTDARTHEHKHTLSFTLIDTEIRPPTLICSSHQIHVVVVVVVVVGPGHTIERSAIITLQEALAHLQLGNFSKASRKCGDVLREVSHRGSWTPDQTRAKCVEIGARATLALDDVKSAKNFLSVALRVRRSGIMAWRYHSLAWVQRVWEACVGPRLRACVRACMRV